jgi:type I restriction enzyme, S subunit
MSEREPLHAIPANWERKKLKYVASLKSGDAITSDDITETGAYPVFGGNGIRGYSSTYTHCGKHVLIGRQGALCGNINYADGCFWASEHAVVAAIKGNANVTWLGELLRSMNLNQYSQSAAQPGLAVDVIANLAIPVPPLQQQLAIAAFLNRETARLDGLVASKERMLGLLDEKRRSLIARAVTRGLNPHAPLRDSGISWLGEIPAHWEVKRVKYIFGLVADPAPEDNSFELLSLYTDIGVRPRKELEARGNKASTTDNYWIVQRGDLVVNKLLAWMGAFGVSDYDGVTSPAYDILRPIADIEPYYYHHLFRCGICQPEIRRRSYGIMDMRLRLYFDRLGDMAVPVPPRGEQARILEHVRTETSQLERIDQATERTIDLLRERRAALIAAAVTGQLDVS